MQGNKSVLMQLNMILRHQLTHINQYFLHSRMLKDYGFEKLSKIAYKQSIIEMKNADDIIERILFLDGIPNLQDLGKLYIGENVKEMIVCDLRAENIKERDIIQSIDICEKEQDYVTRQLLIKHKKDNEDYIGFLEEQLELFDELGNQNYLQTVI